MLLFCLIIGSMHACTSGQPPQDFSRSLRIFAASSLTSVLPKILEIYKVYYPEAKIEFNFAASSILAKQIEKGARADIFISAHPQWIDYLQIKGRLENDTRKEFLGNKLVLIIPGNKANEIGGLRDLTKASVERIALANWAHVPAGMYAKTALEQYGIWRQINYKCIPALDVRAALTYVERRDVDCGIVYRTDARISTKVKVVQELPADIQPNIQYEIVLTRQSNHTLCQPFLAFLYAEEALAIFRQSGFELLSNE